ncbi:lysozyme inhibitor LprI family protein [Leptothoe sp. PORK10 BA2]|uniref:lysozyme inhibitor LprI family protein n=1 Tax=Leptothoe sp. PORK10 BA2 TaxID=3110254 RepID=UPI002B1FC084|nr:lysozyme inhibitor LprI family protein [Leptothoe sp. PORK10 BA2]MEA5463582.1 lysozyme inhibitor LprI family protein [Leptothoe sp. PORK10 BA2]
MGKLTNQLVSLVPLILILGLFGCGRSQPVTAPEESVETPAATTDGVPAPTAEASAPTAAPPENNASQATPASPAGAATNAAPRTSPVALAKKDCGQMANQLEMNQCAAENYGISDKELNQVYQTVMQGLDADVKAQLTTAEERWIVFRDAECNFEANRFEGGSIAPMVEASCLEQITDNRIAELRQTTQPDSSYGDADAQLNQVYQAVQALATEAQGESLTDVQLTWLDYRDAHCAFEVARSSASAEQACLAAVTETRLWQLQALEDEWSL